MVKASHEQIKEILKTLPIGYYLGARTPVIYEESGSSFCNLMDGTIHVSGETVMHGLAHLPADTDPYETENAVRAILYHELSHVICTPTIPCPKWFNTFEDERIETLLSKYYLGVNFKRMCLAVNGWTEDWKPEDAEEYFYGIVRFRQGPGKFVKRVPELIRRWKGIRATTSHYRAEDYKYSIEQFWDEVEADWMRNRQQRQQEQEQRNQQRQQQQEQNKQQQQNQQQNGQGQQNQQNQQGGSNGQSGEQNKDQQGQGGGNSDQDKQSGDKQQNGGSGSDKDKKDAGDKNAEGGNGSDDADKKDGKDKQSQGNGGKGDQDKDNKDGDQSGSGQQDGSQEQNGNSGNDGADDKPEGSKGHGNTHRDDNGQDAKEQPHNGKGGKQGNTDEGTEQDGQQGTGSANGDNDEGEGETEGETTGQGKGDQEDETTRMIRELAEGDNEDEINEIDRDSIARDFDKLINHFADTKIGHILERLVIQHNKKRKLRSPMSLGYTGKVDLKSVAVREDYRWFSRKGGDGQNLFGSTHLTLWVDCSGSFSDDIGKINSVIHELNKLARKMGREFSFDVVQMTMKNKVVPTTKQLEAMGCNGFGPGVEECIRKTRKQGCNNYNVVVWDGDMFSGFGSSSRNAYLPVLHKAFNNQDTVLVSDGENERYIANHCPKARSKIIHGRYAEQFIGELMKLLSQVLV